MLTSSPCPKPRPRNPYGSSTPGADYATRCTALPDALARYVRQPALISRFGARSRELAERKFHVAIANQRLLELMALEE